MFSLRKIIPKLFTLIVFLFCFSCQKKASKLLYANVLSNTEHWVIEQQPLGTTFIQNDILEIIDAKGCTVWFKHKLKGNIKISYDATVIDNGGPHDRVSDLNCFWMATDPQNPKDFFKNSKFRAGRFSNYHNLKLYYVGYGGHDNTKTRFRRYKGTADRPLLKEHDLSDRKFMITANKKMHIEILVDGNKTTYSRNGEIVFNVHDPEPYTEGYFGFRTLNNHMKIENFSVSKL
tara:strand:- start:9192 stop:9890 length:699 start_codon:yes stop_codon:yes gene_type:complete